MEVFAQIVNGFQFLTNFAKSSILDVWQDHGFLNEVCNDFAEKAPSHMFDRVLNSLLKPLFLQNCWLLCLQNLINMTVLYTVKST